MIESRAAGTPEVVAFSLRSCLVLVCATAVACEPEPASEESLDGGDDGALDLDPVDPEDPSPEGTFSADVVLRNRVALVMPVEIALLPEGDALDCDAVEEDPAAALPRERFDEGTVHDLDPHQMIAVWPHEPGERECYAAWIETDGLGARLLFWRDGEPPFAVHTQHACCDIGEGVVELMPVDAGARLELLGNDWLVWTP